MAHLSHRTRYLPPYHLPTSVLRERWGGVSKGVRSKAVQATDDDALTLALRCAENVLDGREDVSTVTFATSTPVYQSGSVTPMLVEALGLGSDVYSLTFTASPRAGTAALRAAHDAVAASNSPALVVCADAPTPVPGSDREKTAGAGASAAVLEPDSGPLSLSGYATESRSILESWQGRNEIDLHTADDRFTRDSGYVETTSAAIDALLDDVGWDREDVTGLAATQPNVKYLSRLGSKTGIDPLTLDFTRTVGGLGTAGPLAELAGASLDIGDRIVLAGYGAGTADALAYTAEVTTAGTGSQRESTELSYVEYLEFTNNLRTSQ